jgi:HK97 gp10 family phage protein
VTVLADVEFVPGFDQEILLLTRDFVASKADDIQTLAKRFAPFDEQNNTPGHVHLRDSIEKVPDGDGFQIGSAVEYSIYQELGTRYMSPNPYLRPAVDEVLRSI